MNTFIDLSVSFVSTLLKYITSTLCNHVQLQYVHACTAINAAKLKEGSLCEPIITTVIDTCPLNDLGT